MYHTVLKIIVSPAQDVLITDVLPSQIINAPWSASAVITPISGTRYAWQVPDLAWQQGGTITITGLISASDISLAVTNTAAIATSSVEQYVLPSLSNRDTVMFTIVNPDIAVTPNNLSVSLGTGLTTTRPITVGNNGAAILQWNLASNEAAWLSATLTSGNVLPGQTMSTMLTFDAAGLPGGVRTSALRFNSNDPDTPQRDVPITLTVLAPQISVTPGSLAITLTENLTATHAITVSNLGTLALTWRVTETAPVSWLAETPLAGSILPGNKAIMTATLSTVGLASGLYSATLRFTSDDPVQPTVDVPITLRVPYHYLYLPLIMKNG